MIEVRDVVHRYAGQSGHALSGVNLHVREGSLFGLLGPNGSGKTTLISILTGILRANEGHVVVGGLGMPARAREVQRFISLVPQENAFYPTLSIAENLKFFASVQHIPVEVRPARVEEALHITGLSNATGIRANRLSGGMKRRLSIALGLLNHPRLLFLDEPTVGIDPQSRQFLLDAIKGINARGTTVVYCSHYMEEVEYLCDEVAILDNGRVLKQGLLATLLDESRVIATDRPVRQAGLQELFFQLTKRELRDA
ncbi:MAG: ABC transporter ATP-binding protein [Phycisphaerae bacterium]|nr:ABC transporter ATP-binding protein [Gemmatimonadaceae bacterium]